MRRLLTTTALGLLVAAPAVTYGSEGLFDRQVQVTNEDIYVAGFINRPVYATETEVVDGTRFAENELTAVGEIDDVLLGPDGAVKAVVLGVGGILEIGEKNVVVRFEDLHFVEEQGEADEFLIVLQTTAEQVESAPAFEYDDARSWWGG